MADGTYRKEPCSNCGRTRVAADDGHADIPAGVCDKCGWDADRGDYATVTRPDDPRVGA